MAKWVCTICGYECEGDTPEVPCPVCGAGEEAYENVRKFFEMKAGGMALCRANVVVSCQRGSPDTAAADRRGTWLTERRLGR